MLSSNTNKTRSIYLFKIHNYLLNICKYCIYSIEDCPLWNWGFQLECIFGARASHDTIFRSHSGCLLKHTQRRYLLVQLTIKNLRIPAHTQLSIFRTHCIDLYVFFAQQCPTTLCLAGHCGCRVVPASPANLASAGAEPHFLLSPPQAGIKPAACLWLKARAPSRTGAQRAKTTPSARRAPTHTH